MNEESRESRAYARLEEVITAAGTQIQALRRDLRTARERSLEMQELLRKFTGGEEDPSKLLARLQALESENEDLVGRLQRGKEGVERLLARIRFLEEQG